MPTPEAPPPPAPRGELLAQDVDLHDEALDAIPRPLWRGWQASFGAAFAGVARTIATQRNMKVHVVSAFLVLLVGMALELDLATRAALIFCAAAVWFAEILNTALEAFVDLHIRQFHRLAMLAKDAAAAAVLVMAVGTVLVFAEVLRAHWAQVVAAGQQVAVFAALGGPAAACLGVILWGRRKGALGWRFNGAPSMTTGKETPGKADRGCRLARPSASDAPTGTWEVWGARGAASYLCDFQRENPRARCPSFLHHLTARAAVAVAAGMPGQSTPSPPGPQRSDDDGLALLARVGPAQRPHTLRRPALGGAQVHEQHLVFLGVDDLGDVGNEFLEAPLRQVALEHRELQPRAGALEHLEQLVAPRVSGDVVGDDVARDHRVLNPG